MTDSDLCAGNTQRVLVDGDEVPVQQQVPRLLPDVAQVIGHEAVSYTHLTLPTSVAV